jgi:glycosyltransferase involved in cell wall biosynthesis
MTPRLTLLLPGDPDTPTGGYLYDRRIVAELRALGWHVQVVSLDPSFPAPTAAALVGAAAALAALPDDALALLDGLAGGAMPRELAAQAARLRLVALVHHPLAAETGLEPALAGRLREAERAALRAMRAVVVTSEETAQALRSDYDVPEAALAVIEPGAPDEAAPVRGARRPGPLRLLCVATLVPRKGHALLLRALAACGDADWTLDCIGSADRDPACALGLQQLAGALQLLPRVRFHGEVSPQRLQAAYADADLFVLPAWYEGYGMAVAEAVAHGLPVLATAVGAAPRVLGDSAGLLVPPGDAAALEAALRLLLGDAELRHRLAAGAARRARTLPRWRDAGARFAALLERVAAA